MAFMRIGTKWIHKNGIHLFIIENDKRLEFKIIH
jgi:hypothetical protein